MKMFKKSEYGGAAQLCKDTKKYWIVHFIYLNKAVFFLKAGELGFKESSQAPQSAIDESVWEQVI